MPPLAEFGLQIRHSPVQIRAAPPISPGPTTMARGFFMTYDCLSCGACCYGPEDYVAVTGPDRDRMDARSAGRYVIRRGDRLWLRMVNGHCAARNSAARFSFGRDAYSPRRARALSRTGEAVA